MRPAICIFTVLCASLLSLQAFADEPSGKDEEPKQEAPADVVALTWAAESKAPQPGRAPGVDASFHALCGPRDMGLARVASAIVERRLSGKPQLSQRAVKRIARSAGVPYPFVAAWSLSGTEREPEVRGEHADERLADWLAKRPVQGTRRCGVARGTTVEGLEIVAVVVADALAELSPLPIETDVSKWLKLNAHVHPSASGAKVVLLGPRGRPKRVLASLDRGELRSRFTLDQPGRWVVQVVLSMPSGPRPALEMEVYASETPPAELVDEQPSPGKHDARDLLAWLNAERKRDGVATVERSAALDALARAHAIAMVRANSVAHDVGDGTPQERAAQLRPNRVGENVARAATVRRIHEALWDSPSHRENMLDSSFRYVGIAAVQDDRGRVWSVELYADTITK